MILKMAQRYIIGLLYGSFLAAFMFYINIVFTSATMEIYDPSQLAGPGIGGIFMTLLKLMAGGLFWSAAAPIVGFPIITILLIPTVYLTRHMDFKKVLHALTISTLFVALFPMPVIAIAIFSHAIIPMNVFSHYILNDAIVGFSMGWILLGAPLGYLIGLYGLIRPKAQKIGVSS